MHSFKQCMAHSFSDEDLGAGSTVREAPKWRDSAARSKHRDELSRTMTAEFAANRGFKKHYAGRPIAEVEAWLREKDTPFTRIVPCRPVGIR